jgi:hypothetical protein
VKVIFSLHGKEEFQPEIGLQIFLKHYLTALCLRKWAI